MKLLVAMRVGAPLVLAALLTCNWAIAGGLSEQEALSEFSSENAQCAAYNSVMLNCIGQDSRLTSGARTAVEKTRDTALERQLEAGKKAGLSQKALLVRFQLAMKSVMSEADNDCVNVSVLINKYGAFCKALLEQPSEQLEELMTKGAPSLDR